MSDQDTIVAVATALGESAIAVIRVSGPRAFDVVRRLTDLPDPVPSHRALLRTLACDGAVLDQALVLPFVGPRSFTGEDVVELHTHGGLVTVRGVLDALRAGGARSALAGEFSRRALLNDKLDLVQAEAIADVIHARSNAAHRIAQDHLAGGLSQRIEALKEDVAAALLLVEAAIDFAAEEHVYTIGATEVCGKLSPPLSDIESLLRTYDEGRMRSQGVRVAIVGPPNAGKSSLLNVLLGTNRAIVTDIAGTTRDYIEEDTVINGLQFSVIDTAGIRDDAADRVEAAGIERSRELAASADVVLVVADITDNVPAAALLKELTRATHGVLGVVLTRDDMASGVATPVWAADLPLVRVNLLEADSRKALERLLVSLAQSAGVRFDEDHVLIARARHRDLLLDARDRLVAAMQAARDDVGHEFVALDLREALDALGSMTGAITSEDILHRIFSDFCVGK